MFIYVFYDLILFIRFSLIFINMQISRFTYLTKKARHVSKL